MGTPHPLNITQTLDLAERRISNARRIIPDVLDGLDERRAHAGTRGSNETGRSSRGISDPTASVAAELAHLAYQRQDIANAARLILRSIDHLDDCCRATFSRDIPKADPPACVGYPVGHECYDSPGYEFNTAGNPVTRSNRLCDVCELERKRDERAEQKAASERRLRHSAKVGTHA